MNCAFCDNTGWVVVDTGTPLGKEWETWATQVKGMPVPERQRKQLTRDIYGEALGPCPHCERGKTLEFPQEGRGRWGKDGYWRGKSTSFLHPERTNDAPLPLSENKKRMRELGQRFGAIYEHMEL